MRKFKDKLIALLASVAVSAALLSPSLSFAFGVGGMQLDSTLNQKLDASIELIGIQEGEVSSIVVNLAPNAVYERMGIERTSVLAKLKFSLESTPGGEPYVHVTTDEVITEPFLNFLVELNWSNGRLLREFTLLLDPPVLLDEKPSAIETPQADLPPTFTVTKDSSPKEIIETIKPAKVSATEEILETVTEAEETAEINEVLEKILANETLSSEVVADSAAEEAVEEKIEPKTEIRNSLVHEKVQKNEILWHIAEKMRPENISVEQMMLALQRENRQAFYGENISFLKAGAVLRINDVSTLNQISVDDAIDEISRQHQSWLDYQSERRARNAVAAESVTTPKAESAATTAPQEEVASVDSKALSEPRLKLVSPIEEINEDAVSQTNAVLEAATEKLSQLHIELAIATEAVEAGKYENEELLNRLSLLEEHMSEMQSLIQLKDSELQRLQGGKVLEKSIVGEQQFLTPIVLDTQAQNESAATIDDKKQHEKHGEPSLLNDPITIATGIFAIIMLSLLGWFVRSRKTKTIEVEQLVYTEDKEKSLDELFPEEQKEEIESETSIIKFNESKTEEPESEIGVDPLTEISFENTEMLDSNESLLDPIAEADVYLTYEKYGKAEVLLQEAIEADPDRQELKLKLLEVFALSRNIQNFDKQAEELFAAIGGSEENSLWQHAQLMAKDIETASPLFVEVKAEISTVEKAVGASWSPEQVTEFDAEQEQSVISDTELEVDESEVDVSESEVDVKLESDAEQESDVEHKEVVLEDETSDSVSEFGPEPELETELETEPEPGHTSELVSNNEVEVSDEPESESELTPEPVTVSDAELEKAMNSFSESALDKAWDESTGEEVNEIVNEAIENAVTFSTQADSTTTVTSDTTMFLLSDEVGTKLDLAKAYIEMGDQEGAFDLLGEVLEEGTSQQKNEAKELMESS